MRYDRQFLNFLPHFGRISTYGANRVVLKSSQSDVISHAQRLYEKNNLLKWTFFVFNKSFICFFSTGAWFITASKLANWEVISALNLNAARVSCAVSFWTFKMKLLFPHGISQFFTLLFFVATTLASASSLAHHNSPSYGSVVQGQLVPVKMTIPAEELFRAFDYTSATIRYVICGRSSAFIFLIGTLIAVKNSSFNHLPSQARPEFQQ